MIRRYGTYIIILCVKKLAISRIVVFVSIGKMYVHFLGGIYRTHIPLHLYNKRLRIHCNVLIPSWHLIFRVPKETKVTKANL